MTAHGLARLLLAGPDLPVHLDDNGLETTSGCRPALVRVEVKRFEAAQHPSPPPGLYFRPEDREAAAGEVILLSHME